MQIFTNVINSIISYFDSNPQSEFVQKYTVNFKKMSEVKDEDLMQKVEEDAQIQDQEATGEDNEIEMNAK